MIALAFPGLVISVVEDAERAGLLVPNTGSRIFEGTVGSTGKLSFLLIARRRRLSSVDYTGISIATVARAKSVKAIFRLYELEPADD